MARRQLGTAPSNAADTATKGYVDTATNKIVTTDGAQTLTFKTISGASNTITNLPASATPDAARHVVSTAFGAAGAEDGANTWAKLVSISLGGQYRVASLMLAVTTSNSGGEDETVIVSVVVRSGSSGDALTVKTQMIAKSGDSTILGNDAFKIISGAYGTNAELWIKKSAAYCRFSVYEISRSAPNVTITYNDGAAWQSAAPTGAVNNVSSNGVVAAGSPVVTKVAIPSTSTSTGIAGTIAFDSSYAYFCTAANTWRRVAIASW